MKCIGIDIGTSTICGVLYDIQEQRFHQITASNSSEIDSGQSWEKIQSPDRILETVRSVLGELLERCPHPVGIGITGQMHGIVYCDSSGHAVSPLYTWQDGRGNQPFSNTQTYSEYLTEKTGYSLSTGYGLVTHFYNTQKSLAAPSGVSICTIMDYLVMRLTESNRPIIDSTNAASLGFFNMANGDFDRAALDAVGIDPGLLPAIGTIEHPVGFYKERIPVYAAIGDNQSAFAGAVRNRSESVHVTIGTGSQLSVHVDRFANVPFMETRPFPWGGFLLVGASLCGGSAFALLKRFFEETVTLFLPESFKQPDFYRIMTDLAESDESNDPPVIVPHFAGTRLDPTRRGSISNLTGNNFNPKNLVFSMLNGMCTELFNFYRDLPTEFRSNRQKIFGSGNALRKNRLLQKKMEQIFGLPLTFAPCPEEAAFGAALIADKTNAENGLH